MVNKYPSRWELLGFIDDPFFADPLNVSPLGSRLLQGRQVSIGQAIENVLQGESSLQVIVGPVGVGKSSLVNVAQYLLSTGEYEHLVDPWICGQQLLPCSYPMELHRVGLERVEVGLTRTLARNALEWIGGGASSELATEISHWVNLTAPAGGGGYPLKRSQ